MLVERRIHPRYCVKDSTFAVFKAEPLKLAPIIDISLGGIGVSVNGKTEQLNGSSKLEILVDDCRFYLDGLSYRLRPAFRNLQWDSAIFLQNRLLGVKFVDLTSSQKHQLLNFIRKHTIGGKTPQFVRKFNQFCHQVLGRRQFGTSCQNFWLQRPTP